MHTSVFLRFRKAGIPLAGIFAALLAVSPHAQTVSSSINQPDQPSSWFNKQTNEIGLTGFDAATEITPEGYLQTGFEKLMFFTGPDLHPATDQVQILEQGTLPIVHYEFARDGFTYRFTVFAGKIDKSAIIRARQNAKFPFLPGFDITSGIYEPQVDFIRVDITNSAHELKRAVFASGVCYGDPTGAAQGVSRKAGESFNPGWMNYFDDANFYRFNRDLYSFPAGYVDRSFTIRKNWSEPNPQYVLGVTHVDATPTTPVGIVTYARDLKPGETWTLDFKMLVIPNADPFVISAVDDASLDAIEAQVHAEPAAQH